jgi:hypothetical protein
MVPQWSQERHAATKVLARWQQQGWLKRVGPGIYAPIPLDASTTEQVLKDPWVLVPALFAPGYVGGWTAAEHWDFTEQLFRSVFVFTARPFRRKEPTVQGVVQTPQSEVPRPGYSSAQRHRVRRGTRVKSWSTVFVHAPPGDAGGVNENTVPKFAVPPCCVVP